MNATRSIAVLCVGEKTNYSKIGGLELYGVNRPAESFTGKIPVISHPPCRSWSAFCSHQVKELRPGERELAFFCIEQVKKNGGILEQPAHSRLWEAAKLPLPGKASYPFYTIEVWQAWWGYPTQKTTWLLLSKIKPEHVKPPLKLHAEGRDRHTFAQMSHNQRSRTCPAMCEWLVELASHTDL